MKNILTVSFVALCLFGSSCATMLKGTTDQITVVSDPSGAQVASNNSMVGTTPVTFTVPSKQDVNIQVSKAGYQSEIIANPSSFRWGYEIWGFLVYLIPMGVDLADGAAWGHDNLVMTAHLNQVAAAPTASAAPSANEPIAAAAPASAVQ